MPTKKHIFAIIFVAFLGVSHIANATGYNYLPDDVYIKQQQEKSALEYRIKSLESQISGNPQISILTIDQRITELRRQWEDEKTYTTGTLAHNGAGTPEIYASAIAKIDSKYSSQISALEAQKTQYQEQINKQAEIDKEIEKIQQQIKDIDKYYDSQRDAVIQQYQQNVTQPQKQATIGDLYNWLETLPAEEWSQKLELLKQMNPENYKKIEELYRINHPEFFSSEEKVQTSKTTIKTQPVTQKIIEKKAEQKISTTTPTNTSVSTTTLLETKTQPTIIPPQVKPTVMQRVSNFFRSLMFWR